MQGKKNVVKKKAEINICWPTSPKLHLYNLKSRSAICEVNFYTLRTH